MSALHHHFPIVGSRNTPVFQSLEVFGTFFPIVGSKMRGVFQTLETSAASLSSLWNRSISLSPIIGQKWRIDAEQTDH